MQIISIPVCVKNFSEVTVGELFILMLDLEARQRPQIIRKMQSNSQGFNAIIENWEGESSNMGMIHVLDDEDIVELR